MEHVEEAGVHSGDSSCVLPASVALAARRARASRQPCASSRPRSASSDSVNVQLAIVGDDLYVLEANPRASRTVPFASKAIGVNLVDAAVPARRRGLRPANLEPPAPREPSGHVSVKAAVFPLRPLPGRRPRPRAGDALDRRGDGERRGLPFGDREGRACRGASASHRRNGVPLRLRRRQGRRPSTSAGGSSTSASSSAATAGTAHATCGSRAAVTSVRKVGEEGDGATVVDLVRRRRCDLVVNTPAPAGARVLTATSIREAALVAPRPLHHHARWGVPQPSRQSPPRAQRRCP